MLLPVFDVPVSVSSADGNTEGVVSVKQWLWKSHRHWKFQHQNPRDLAIAKDKHQNCWGTWRMQANKNKSFYAHHRISIAC